jgi:ubiquinone/menaquinone biosynthesis C-methylase UbiE
MTNQSARAYYLTRFIAIYRNTPSLAIWRAIEAQALDNIAFEPPTLDLACGTGHFARILLGNRAITGCDLDVKAVRLAAAEKTLDALSVADARALPYSDGVFNSILANCALEHIPDVERVLAEIARVLKPMGILAFTVPSEHFNHFLFFPRFYRFLGLHARAHRHIQWYNTLQRHYHIESLPVWEKRLKTSGFQLIFHRYYMPMFSTLGFSLWDVMAKWTLSLTKNRRMHLQQSLLNRLPNRILSWILHCHLTGYYKASSHSESGGGLLVVARKDQN